MNPTISVIIPTYNRKNLVVEAIRSVMKQEPKNYEIIVIDDGSTDGTSEHIQSLELPIRMIRKENGGVASARNIGIQNAQGQYIALLDSDDLWLPDFLNKTSKYLTDHPERPMVYTNVFPEVEGVIMEKTRFQTFNTNEDNGKSFYLPCFVKPIIPISPSACVIRRSIFNELGLFREDLAIHEDSEMWNRISGKYDLGVIEQPYVIVRWDRDANHLTSGDVTDLFISEGRKYLQIYQKNHEADGTIDLVKKAIVQSYKNLDDLDVLWSKLRSGEITSEDFWLKRFKIFTS